MNDAISNWRLFCAPDLYLMFIMSSFDFNLNRNNSAACYLCIEWILLFIPLLYLPYVLSMSISVSINLFNTFSFNVLLPIVASQASSPCCEFIFSSLSKYFSRSASGNSVPSTWTKCFTYSCTLIYFLYIDCIGQVAMPNYWFSRMYT